MIYKPAILCFSVFILASVNCTTFAESELDVESKQKTNEETNKEKPVFGNLIGDIQVALRKVIEDVSKSTLPGTNKTTLMACMPNPARTFQVEVANASTFSRIIQVEQNSTYKGAPGTCMAVLFYSPSCPFSCLAAPHFNALPRHFPDLRVVAVDVIANRIFNTQYGILGTPTLMLFHGGRPAFRFNETSDYGLGTFANFINQHTGMEPYRNLEVMSQDYSGPVPSVVVKKTDYYLTLSWMVIAARILYSTFYSTWGRSLADATLNAWREAEAQHHYHQHAD